MNGVRVCQAVLASTLGIHRSRLAYIRQKKTAQSGIVINDMRGQHVSPRNKLSEHKVKAVTEFLKKFPKYVSHYSNNNKCYFPPNLTKAKLYNIYKLENEDSVSYNVFNKKLDEFNVSFYKPKKDTCSRCDEYKAAISNQDVSEERRKKMEEEHQEHLKRASEARKLLKNTEQLCRTQAENLVFTFDMEKTQPMPHINTSVAFYKRQLWLYNLGINNRATNKATMCIWTEVEAKRGSNEVGSSLLAYLQDLDLCNYKYIHTFSDACGGQNRNKNIVALFFHICNTTPVSSWTHSFMESGHSFLPNDTDFGKIERRKNYRQNIFDFSEWESLISECNFNIIKMADKFYDISTLTKQHTFRSFNSNGEKFNWLKLKWLRISSDNSIMEYKESCNADEEIKFIDFSPSVKNTSYSIDLTPLYNNDPPKISQEKYKDIKSLLQFVPPVYHSYYENLPHKTGTTDELENIDDLF